MEKKTKDTNASMDNIYTLNGKVPEMFAIFPELVRTIFAENCVAVVFVAAVILNLVMPKETEETV